MKESETVVRLENVTKQYRRSRALNHCTLEIKRGRIYGLVGKNGAGKTTMMRLIAGLSIPTEGRIEFPSKQENRRIGMLIEAPSLNYGMTARDNLRFYRMLAGQPRSSGQDEALLELVGLSDTGGKKVRDFSLGMRQRLGIAAAVLGKPAFLMLDEPVNGLDPVGVVEIRKLIGRLCTESGMTILISSHNLPELFQTATDYVILDRGAVQKEITHEALEKAAGKNLEAYFLSVIGEKDPVQTLGGGWDA